MRKFISFVLIFVLISTFVGCRRANTVQDTVSQSTTLSSYTSSIPSSDNLIENSSEAQIAVCTHSNTTIINYVAATCVDNGYTGDTICTQCNVILSVGTQTTAIGHDTEIRNTQAATTSSQGYTGDMYCKICGIMISKGQAIPVLEEIVPPGKLKYVTDNGYVYIVDEGVDITDFSMKQQTKAITHHFYNIEQEIFNLCNAEREQNGLAPLSWYEEAYYFTNIRAEEIYVKWDHTRPDGTKWHSVYTNADVLLQLCAENLARQQGGNDIAESVVKAWMESTSGHRESILNPNYTKVSISVIYIEDDATYCVAQHFFG